MMIARAGRFLLTGSANILTLPQVSESLAGRMEIVSLLPLSRAEIRGKKPSFLKAAFDSKLGKPAELMIGKDLVQAVLTGGYPEMLRREDHKRRQIWARDYIRAIVQGDVREVADVEKLDQMSRLLQVLAHHSGRLTNFTQMGAQVGFDDKTTRKYVAILEQLFLVRKVEPWFQNQLKRLVKISEVLKQTSWFGESCSLYHYRDKDQDEVDLVIERGVVHWSASKSRRALPCMRVTSKGFESWRTLAAISSS
jgi:predicted AAA+ superfamily ATPase